MSFLYRLYLKAPISIKNVIVSLKGHLNSRLRYGDKYEMYLESYSKNIYADLDELYSIQIKEFKQLFSESILYSDYYKIMFAPYVNKLADINTHSQLMEFLIDLPLLPKSTLKNSLDSIVNNNPERNVDVVNYTSGTTGTPTVVYYDRDSIQRSFAFWSRFHKWIGLPTQFKSVRLSGRILVKSDITKPPYWVYNAAEKQLLMSTYHLTEDRIGHYIRKMESFKPILIDAYPSAIYIIAKFIIEQNINHTIRPQAIATTAETLHEYQRKVIEEAFFCKVYNQYASSEGGAFITECSHGKLHLNLDSGIFEFNKIEGSNNIGELIITSFRQWKTPLIRYKSGDFVDISDFKAKSSCACGSKMPEIKSIFGRVDDILYTKEKGYVGRMDPAYKGLYGIEKSQIIQHSIDLLEIIQIVNENYDCNAENLLISNVRDRLGSKIDIKISLVKDIPLSANGKFKSVIRKFKID